MLKDNHIEDQRIRLIYQSVKKYNYRNVYRILQLHVLKKYKSLIDDACHFQFFHCGCYG